MHALKRTCTASAVSFALLQMGAASAQERTAEVPPGIEKSTPAAAGKEQTGLNLDQIVVTGAPVGISKMKSSISVSTLTAEQLQLSAPTSAAEALRAIPGIRAESSGGEGNANLTVRGVPISAGGARYVQFQEDGLPLLQFGDFAFVTPDMFLRADNSLDHLEVVRGGSASTAATNSPGGILNFISKNGDETGGSIGYSRGLGFDQSRYEFEYGNKVAAQTRFYVGGFYRKGEGVRTQGVTGEQGGQIKANLTQDFDNGFVRVSVKHLDDRTPTNLPVPVRTVNGQISELPGIDPRTASFYSPYWVRDVVLDKNNNRVSTDINDGLHAKSNAFGVEASFKLGNGFTLTDNFRKADNSGRFTGIFPADSGTDGSYVFATGPNQGAPYVGRAFTAVVFNTAIEDAGNTLNDLKLSRQFDFGGSGKLTALAGLYTSLQNLAVTWNFNSYLLQAIGENPALLQTASTTPGLIAAGTDVFGGCCNRAIDAKYRTTAPYLSLSYELGPLNLDGSVRNDRQKASGTFNQAVAQQYQASTTRNIDYSRSHTSYSLGGNYRLNSNLALFARASDGVAFNADRILFNPYEVNGSTPIPINTVTQQEAGVKYRDGALSTFVTVFNARTRESNYEATTQLSSDRTYDAKGVEIEAGYKFGTLRIDGGLTYTHAKISAAENPAFNGNTPRRQADYVYQVTPSYRFGAATIGATLIGTSKSYGDDANLITLPAYRVVNLFGSYRFDNQLTLLLSANNLFNTIGYTEIEGDGHAARSVNGRAVKVALKYAF